MVECDVTSYYINQLTVCSSGLEFKRPSNRNCLPSMTKQKQMLRKFFEVGGQVRLKCVLLQSAIVITRLVIKYIRL